MSARCWITSDVDRFTLAVGLWVGAAVRSLVGLAVGSLAVGPAVGSLVGPLVGLAVGSSVGLAVGSFVGLAVVGAPDPVGELDVGALVGHGVVRSRSGCRAGLDASGEE